MLGNYTVRPEIAVKDLEKSKGFYADTLGLKLLSENDQALTFQCGDSKLDVYQSSYAGTNQATYAMWQVDDVKGVVEQLKAKGVSFEHYDLPGMTLEGDVHSMDGMQAAWFKDPDGNILSVASGME